MRVRSMRWFAAGLSAAVIAGGCGRDEPEPGPAPATADSAVGAGAAGGGTAPAGPVTVTVTAGEYAFAPPAEVRGGLVEVRLANRGKEAHHMTLYRLTDGKTVDEFREAMLGAPPYSPVPEWAVPAGGPGAAAPGDDSNAFLDLAAGSYAMVCYVPAPDGAPHYLKGMLQGLEVVPGTSAGGAAEPEADLSVELVDYDFRWSSAPSPGEHRVRVVNAGPQHHEVQVFRLAEEKTLDDFMTHLRGMMGAGPAVEEPGRWVGGLSTIHPGGEGTVDVALEAGRYVLVCFEPDVKDGRPHFMHGMVKEIAVGEAAAD
jgi:hypothetical protein